VAWETTRNCNLACVHCRAAATNGPYSGELDTAAAFRLLDQIAEVGKPIVILTGGEPLLREDIFDIARYGTDKGLRMVMAPNGTLITANMAQKMAASGIQRISISLDGATAESHDAFRGVDGAYDGALQGIEYAKAAGIDFQINTTITKTNLDQIPKIQELAAESLGAVAHHIFLLVPTGRGKYIVDQEIDAKEYEETLNWFYDQRDKTPLQLKATCAPHYYRILRQRPGKRANRHLRIPRPGCRHPGLPGRHRLLFHLPHAASSSPAVFWTSTAVTSPGSPLPRSGAIQRFLLSARNFAELKDKCGACEYKRVCGGCRARAYEATDYMAQEPLCQYKPGQ
jgi:MoaA/NifB/PqqE/SkfB family radical SAM enzyme